MYKYLKFVLKYYSMVNIFLTTNFIFKRILNKMH